MTRKRRIFFETQEVVRKTKRGYVDLEMDYFQFYNAAFSQVASLSSSCSKDFILWVMSHVNEDNGFIYSQQMFRQFNEDLAKITKPKQYVESTMKMALRELTETGIINRIGRGEYKVNPRLFWTDETNERIKSIKEIEISSTPVSENGVNRLPVYTEAELDMLTPDNRLDENSTEANS